MLMVTAAFPLVSVVEFMGELKEESRRGFGDNHSCGPQADCPTLSPLEPYCCCGVEIWAYMGG